MQAASNVVSQVENAAAEVKDDVTKAEQEVVKNVEESASEVAKTAEETVNKSGEQIEQDLEEGQKKVENAASEVEQKVIAAENVVAEKTAEGEAKIDEVKDKVDGETASLAKKVDDKIAETESAAQENIDSVKDQADTAKEEVKQKVENTKTEVEQTVEKEKEELTKTKNELEAKVENVKTEAIEKTEELEKAVEENKNETESKLKDAGKDKMADMANMATSVKGAMPTTTLGKNSNLTVINDKATALYSHMEIRNLHGSKPLQWCNDLAKSAEKWATTLAEGDLGLQHSEQSGRDYGENVYIAKGSSSHATTAHAVLQWYKTVIQYRFDSPAFTLSTGTFTQLIWDSTKSVGVGVVYHEEKRITYIVAHYSPPGNPLDPHLYARNVKPPKSGQPPKAPKLEDLVPQEVAESEEQSGSNMKSLVDVLCHWCVSTDEKPVESWSGTQQIPQKDCGENKP